MQRLRTSSPTAPNHPRSGQARFCRPSGELSRFSDSESSAAGGKLDSPKPGVSRRSISLLTSDASALPAILADLAECGEVTAEMVEQDPERYAPGDVVGLSGLPPWWFGWKQFRAYGAVALDLCAVAAGQSDGYVEEGPQRWDWAAGALVVTEAGGRFELLPGTEASRALGMPERGLVAAGWWPLVGGRWSVAAGWWRRLGARRVPRLLVRCWE